MKKFITRIITSSLICLAIVGCVPQGIARNTSDLGKLYIGIPYSEAKEITKNTNSRFEIEESDFIRVRGLKLRYVRYAFLNRVQITTEKNATGPDTKHKDYYYDAFFVVFDENDKLLTMGYPYEFLRSSDSFEVQLGEELAALITEDEDE